MKTGITPTILVIFGITGDLSKRYLLPSLYHLVEQNLLDEHTEIIGITRGSLKIDELLSTIELCVNSVDKTCDPVAMKKLRDRIHTRHMDVTKPEEYDALLKELHDIEDKHGVHMNRLYYLSIPPSTAQPIITMLGEHGLNASCLHGAASTRLLIEKPFGFDLVSAQELIETTSRQFGEDQVFRIDHYLAKETVQNILAVRFNNPIFTPLWNSTYIDYIEVLANEKLDIEGRVNFYEQTGALRDLVQSHLLQVLALVTMDQPDELTSDKIHEQKSALMKLLQAVPPHKIHERVVRGQYDTYKTDVGNPHSTVETFVALQTFITNKQWSEVPLIVKTGKALTQKLSEVNVVFKPSAQSPHHNVLTFTLQPNESLKLSLRVKKPGFDNEIEPIEMEFKYKNAFGDSFTPTAYERVLMDAIRGDHTLFATASEIIESWRVVQPLLDAWAKSSEGLEIYQHGGSGPDTSKLYPAG
jgi:glucose-6-phosphate 1-dehydrogenase